MALFGIPFLILFFLAPIVDLPLPISALMVIYIIVSLASAGARTMLPIIKYRSTTYTLHEHHLEFNYRLVSVHTRSIEYDHIIDIVVKRSLGDRIVGTGTIIMHTAEDSTKDLQLQFLNKSEAIKQQIQRLMRASKSNPSNIQNQYRQPANS